MTPSVVSPGEACWDIVVIGAGAAGLLAASQAAQRGRRTLLLEKNRMTTYRIFPPIGLARLGEDSNFFVGPEVPGAGPGELRPDGSLGPVTQFKDANGTITPVTSDSTAKC